MSLHRVIWLALIACLLNACGTMQRQLDVDHQLQDDLRRMDTWRVEGKLGVRVNGEARSAHFAWQHEAHTFALRLSGPFGQGTTWLRQQGRRVTLDSPDQPARQARTAEQLMQGELGWQVPITNLRYWIKGIAAPGHDVRQLHRNPDGTLAELHQQGWQITYSRYRMHNGWALPGKLVAQRGDIQLTMIIKSWELAVQEKA